jgi:hypothetical protein
VSYLEASRQLPDDPQRLAFFLPHTDSPDELVASDAYAEFARAPVAEYVAIRSRLEPAWLLERIGSLETKANRRTLYLMLLGVCGTPEDARPVAEILRRRDERYRPSLHAAVVCYLWLAGADGVPLIEDLFFRDPTGEWTDTYAAIVAVRFCGEESDAIPRSRLLQAFRHLLARPDYVDFVIVDFARWEDWSIVEPLSRLFRELPDRVASDTIVRSVRFSIVQYLHACPLAEAKIRLEEIRRVAPDCVRAAEAMYGVNSGEASQSSVGSSNAAVGSQRADWGEGRDGMTVEALDGNTMRIRFLLAGTGVLACLIGLAVAAWAANRRRI